jgi:hypothetical protein
VFYLELGREKYYKLASKTRLRFTLKIQAGVGDYLLLSRHVLQLEVLDSQEVSRSDFDRDGTITVKDQ